MYGSHSTHVVWVFVSSHIMLYNPSIAIMVVTDQHHSPPIRLTTDIIQNEAHRNLALSAAQESIVLLKNADPPQGLPLGAVDTACVSSIHCIGYCYPLYRLYMV